MLFFYSQIPIRSSPPDILTSGAIIFIRMIALPFGGSGQAGPLGHYLVDIRPHDFAISVILTAASTVFFGALLVRSAMQRSDAFWLFTAALFIALVALLKGVTLGDNGYFVFMTGRYNYISIVPLSWGLLALTARASGFERSIYVSFATIVVIVGVLHYDKRSPYFDDGPSWREEVARWRSDDDYKLWVWPTFKPVDLSSKTVRCPSAQSPDLARGPAYCEATWLAQFKR